MELIKPALTSFLRKKKLILYILSLSITIGILISLLYITYSINITYGNKIKNNIVNRTLFVSKNDNANLENDLYELSKVTNIIDVYNFIQPINACINNEYFCTIRTGSNEEFPPIVIGKELSNESVDEVQVIIPDKIFGKNKKIVYGKDLLNKNIDIVYNSYSINAKVVGIYSDVKNTQNIYMSQNNIRKFTLYDKELIQDNAYIAIINNYNNVDSVKKDLLKQNYSSNIYDVSGEHDIKFYKTASIIITILISTILIFNYALISIIIENIIDDEKVDIALLKAIGYKVNDLKNIMQIRIFIIVLSSYSFGILISLVLNTVLNIIGNCKFNLNVIYDYSIYYKILLMFFLVLNIISNVLVYIKSKKIKRIACIVLLKEN